MLLVHAKLIRVTIEHKKTNYPPNLIALILLPQSKPILTLGKIKSSKSKESKQTFVYRTFTLTSCCNESYTTLLSYRMIKSLFHYSFLDFRLIYNLIKDSFAVLMVSHDFSCYSHPFSSF